MFHSEKSLARFDNADLFWDKTEPDSQTTLSEANNTSQPIPHVPVSAPAPKIPAGGLFQQLEKLLPELKALLVKISASGTPADLVELTKFAQKIRQFVNSDDDVCIGAVHLLRKGNLFELHALFSAILAEILGRELELVEEARKFLLLAALTSNISIINNYDACMEKSETLEIIRDQELYFHPEQSAKILSRLGMRNTVLLEIIRQHHELPDGSGYPNNIKADQLRNEAAILRIIDSYLRLILPPGTKKAISPRNALQKLYQDAEEGYEPIFMGLIKELGIYPPGCLVKLASNEIGYVIRRNRSNTLHVNIAVVRNKDGKPLSIPVYRDSADEEYSVTELLDSNRLNIGNPDTLWGSS